MSDIEIGLWVTAGMMFLVVLGMRVAFAAGLAGFVGLVWLPRRSHAPPNLI